MSQCGHNLRAFLYIPCHRLALSLIACKLARAERRAASPLTDTRYDGLPNTDLGVECSAAGIDSYDSDFEGC